MSPAAQARRNFRLGRPPKIGVLPLHPLVVWQRAILALEEFRTLMVLEKLKREHVAGAIVFIEQVAPEQPQILLVEKRGDTEEQRQKAVFEQLARPDVMALGMVFQQFDENEKKQITFPYQFTGLSEAAVVVLRKAAMLVQEGTIVLSAVS